MIAVYRKLSKAYRDQILSLLFSAFRIIKVPKSYRHFTLLENKKVIGYCALTKRLIQFSDKVYEFYLLGSFTVAAEYRKMGYGTQLLQFVIHDSMVHHRNGILLNCGKSLIDFYRKNGFTIISECAEYYRNNQWVVDHDLVMILVLNKKLIIDKTYLCIRLGKDF